MKSSMLKKTNVIICLIVIFAFCAVYFIYYSSFKKDSLSILEYEISQKSSVVYAEICPQLLDAIETSKRMAKDGFLISYLSADDTYDMESFKNTILRHLISYYKYNKFDGVFLVVEKNMAFYTQDGFISKITEDKDRHSWHDIFISQPKEYDINIDFDKSIRANNEISFFVNHKVMDWSGHILGTIGVYIHLDRLMSKLFELESKSNISIAIIDDKGFLQLSSDQTSLSQIEWTEITGNRIIFDKLTEIRTNYSSSKMDEALFENPEANTFVSIKYLPQLQWFIVVERNMSNFYNKFKNNILISAAIVFSILAILIIFILIVLKKAEDNVKRAADERMQYFHNATRYMFSSIYEIDVTHDCFAQESKKHQFDTLKNEKEMPYSESLGLLAQRTIKKEYQEGFLGKLSCNNIKTEFSRGNEHISIDCPVLFNNAYQWIRFDVHIFLLEDGKTIHAYIYSRDINSEIKIQEEACTDALTRCLTRGATEQRINETILFNKNDTFAFFIIDIDNFKKANDTYGHSFGDFCIQQFADGICKAFRKDDIIGRLGGDEFVVFVKYSDKSWVMEKAKNLVSSLNMVCEQGTAKHGISSSIGISLYPQDGSVLPSLYKNADAALYVVKEMGKNNYMLFENASVCGINNSSNAHATAAHR